MAHVATLWDIWYAGLIDGPEPPGRRSAAAIATSRAEAERNSALASFEARQRWTQQHPPQPGTPDPLSMHHAQMRRYEMD